MRRFDQNMYEEADGVNSSSLTTTSRYRGERNPYFEEYNSRVFQRLSENPSELFNYFFTNQDIFKMINEDDYAILTKKFGEWSVTTMTTFNAALVSMVVLDLFLLRKRVGPKIKPTLKPLYWLAKYFAVPMLAWKAADVYVDMDSVFFSMAEKYQFGLEDYERTMLIFEKAKIAGKFDQLMEQRGNFDFSQLEEVDLEYIIDKKTVAMQIKEKENM